MVGWLEGGDVCRSVCAAVGWVARGEGRGNTTRQTDGRGRGLSTYPAQQQFGNLPGRHGVRLRGLAAAGLGMDGALCLEPGRGQNPPSQVAEPAKFVSLLHNLARRGLVLHADRPDRLPVASRRLALRASAPWEMSMATRRAPDSGVARSRGCFGRVARSVECAGCGCAAG